MENILKEINPKAIINNLDHALKGEQWDKKAKLWVLNASGMPLVNNSCRVAVISYLRGFLCVETAENQRKLSYLMNKLTNDIPKLFVSNLEEFGFLLKNNEPDTDRMILVSNMIYKISYLIFSRNLKAQESIRIFKHIEKNFLNTFKKITCGKNI